MYIYEWHEVINDITIHFNVTRVTEIEIAIFNYLAAGI